MHTWFDMMWPYRRVRHRLSAFPLPFAPSSTDAREWRVEIDPVGTALNQPLPSSGKLQVSLHRLLIESGIALSKATSSWDPRSWFALYRYGGDFAGTAPTLRFYAGVQDKDPRLTAVASEEVATGITCYILREHFGLDHIADVYACIQRGELAYVDTASKSRPDYFCEDASGKTVLAESKGSTGTQSRIAHMIKQGWSQVQNVQPVNLPLRLTCSRVVIGTRFCIKTIRERSETTTFIKDPEGVAGRERNPESDTLMRLAYAKVLRFSGRDDLAERLIERPEFSYRFSEIDDIQPLTNKKIKVLKLGVTPFGDTICLYGPTAKALFSRNTRTLRASVQQSLCDFRDLRGELDSVGYTLPNGTVIIYEGNDWAF